MNRDEIRRLLEHALSISQDDQGQLEACLIYLDDEGYLEDVSDVSPTTAKWNRDDKRAWRGLIDAAQAFLNDSSQATRFVPYHAIQEKEMNRALVISRDEALKLERAPRVRRFRADHLSDHCLDEDEAKALLERLDALPFPLAIDRPKTKTFYELNDIVFAEGGDEREYSMRVRDMTYIASSWTLPDDVFIELPELARPRLGHSDDPLIDPALVALNTGLHMLSAWIEDRVGWTKGQAVWWTLTGRTPLHVPVHVEIETTYRLGRIRETISVIAEHWISHQTISRVYREAQKLLARQQRGRIANRRTEPRALAVYQFVIAQDAEHGHRRPLRDLMNAWNQRYGDEFGHFSDIKRFSETFNRVNKRLTGKLN